MVHICNHFVHWLSILFTKTGNSSNMKYSLGSTFARWILVLFFAVLASTVAGRIVSVTDASIYCNGFPLCIPESSLGWLKLTHILLVGIASILMVIVFRKAWREQRDQRILLPLTTI